jgi:hypothetical protein
MNCDKQWVEMTDEPKANLETALLSRHFPEDNPLKFEWSIIQAHRELLAASKVLPATRK